MASPVAAEDCPPAPSGHERWLPPFERWTVGPTDAKFDVVLGHGRVETRTATWPGSGWGVDELAVLAPEDPEGLEVFVADGCERTTDRPAWASALEGPLGFFRCSRTSWEGAFIEHPDGLLLRISVAVDDDGAPGCAARRMLESLAPRDPELSPPSSPLAPRGACAGRCVFRQGMIESRSPIRMFEVEMGLLSTSTQVLYEVKPAGSPRFWITIGSSPTYFPDYRGADVVRVLGFDLPGTISRYPDGGSAWGATMFFTPPDWGSLPRRSFYIILSADDDAAMERGWSFLASMRRGPDWQPGARLEPYVPYELPVHPPKAEEPGRFRGLALPIAATLLALVAAFAFALRRRRAGKRPDAPR